MNSVSPFQVSRALTLVAIGWLMAAEMTSSDANAQSAGAPKKQTAQMTKIQREIGNYQSLQEDLISQRKIHEAKLMKLSYSLEHLHKEQDKKGVSADSFAEILKTLQSQRVELLIDLAGMNARREAVFELKKKIEEGSNSIVSDLEKLVKLEQEELDRAEDLYSQKGISKSDYQRAKSRLLEVRIRLAEAKRPNNNSSLLNDELLNSSLDRAEKKARLEKTESLLQAFTESRSTLDETAEIQKQIKQIRNFVVALNSEFDQISEAIDKKKEQLAELIQQQKQSHSDEQ